MNNQSVPLFLSTGCSLGRKCGAGSGAANLPIAPQVQAKLVTGEPLCGLHLSVRPAPLAESKSPHRAARREAIAERLIFFAALRGEFDEALRQQAAQRIARTERCDERKRDRKIGDAALLENHDPMPCLITSTIAA